VWPGLARPRRGHGPRDPVADPQDDHIGIIEDDLGQVGHREGMAPEDRGFQGEGLVLDGRAQDLPIGEDQEVELLEPLEGCLEEGTPLKAAEEWEERALGPAEFLLARPLARRRPFLARAWGRWHWELDLEDEPAELSKRQA
jgi:hypothetical protein